MSHLCRTSFLALGAFLLAALCSCTEDWNEWYDDGSGHWTESGTQWDGGGASCMPGRDTDKDKIPDQVEGCGKNPPDTDGDNLPDYNDPDADGDKIPDSIEAGPNPNSPRDSDGDKIPDYKETDSDGDGVKDGDEDLNLDGLLGCCLATCGEKRSGCPVVKANECGLGQTCAAGKCQPAVDFLCSNGETDPTKKVTFTSSGKSDDKLPTFICHKSGEAQNQGLKPMTFKTATTGQWKIAIETTSTYGEVSISAAGAKEAGATFDLKGNNQMVAGFIVSLSAPGSDVTTIVTQLVTKINGLPGKTSVTLLSSGITKTSLDSYATVVSTQVAINMSTAQQPSAVRDALIKTLLAKQVTQLPAAFGATGTAFHLRFQTLLRTDGRLLIMGAVALNSMMVDPTKDAAIHVDDLSNGTGLATPSNSDSVECDPFKLSGTPTADIIWVIDESGSMSDNRQDVANNAKDFFARAVSSGLDFRIAVTGVDDDNTYGFWTGKFCSTISSSSYDSGGPDRFLKSSEQSIFESCAKNPPGYEGGSEYGLVNARAAVTTHLPRKPNSANDLTKIRTEATLVIIHATDELPNSIYNVSGASSYYKTCQLPANIQQAVNTFVQQDIDLFTGKTQSGEGKAVVHMIGGVCNNTCSAYIGHGYNEVVKATQGLTADVCQANLGTTMQIIIDSIIGQASPAKLQYVPISASLAVAVDQTKLQRSLTKGFNYTATTNTLTFIGVPFPKGSMVVASYRRWVNQVPVK